VRVTKKNPRHEEKPTENLTVITATRFHDCSIGHRVFGHESKCALLHGHNYRIHFTCAADRLDNVGRVVDFSVINDRLCQWLEKHWDHKMLLWVHDPYAKMLMDMDIPYMPVMFNPTAENMALYLLHNVGPSALDGTGVTLISVVIEETRKCRAEAKL
jgi:6-pyruvoyltetrahydropterin/6-carboxytetrahydropterin synthase